MAEGEKLSDEELRKVFAQFPATWTTTLNPIGNYEVRNAEKVYMGYVDAQTGNFVKLDGVA